MHDRIPLFGAEPDPINSGENLVRNSYFEAALDGISLVMSHGGCT